MNHVNPQSCLPHRSFRWILFLGLLFLALTGSGSGWAQGTNTVATLVQLEGIIQVVEPGGRLKVMREGQFVYAGEEVRTSTDSKVSILFRDNSRVRLYANSNFLIQEAEERPTTDRSFRFQMELKQGRLQGRFQPRRQLTRLRTPVATVGIKGTSIWLGHSTRNGTTVGLSEGLLEVENAASTLMLQPGQWIPQFVATDNLSDRVQPLPRKVLLKTEDYELPEKNNGPIKLFLSIQLIDSQSGKDIKEGGLVLLESDYPGVRMPTRVNLDRNGFLRIPILIEPPLKGMTPPELVRLYAIMDGPNFEDVGEGLLVLKWRIPNQTQRMLLDPVTDEFKQLP